MKFLKVFTLIFGLHFKVSWAVTSKLDPNVGSNWHVPPNPSASVRSDPGNLYYTYNAVNSQPVSSFAPTSSLTPQGSHYLPTQYDGSQKPYTNSEYSPEGIPAQGFTYEGQVKPEENAEHRQEIERQEDDGPGFGGGIGNAAAGIASAVGLGGLGIAGSIIVLAIGGPLIALAVLFPVAILIVAILGFPVLKLTLPPSDPNLARSFKSGMRDVASRAMEAVQSEECVERLSCMLARRAKRLPYEDWILEKMSASNRPWTTRISKSVKVGRSGENCDSYKCSPASKVSELYQTFLMRSRQ